MDQLRFSSDGAVIMVWDEDEPLRCPTQEDMDNLPVGDDMSPDEIITLED